MPRTNIDYSKTLIYKIICNDMNCKDIYVGSTTDFTRRKNEHKRKCNNIAGNSYNLKLYENIRENGNWENWTMIEIEKYPCNDGNESRARERYYLEILNASLNTIKPNRSPKEYYEDNKDKILKSKQIYKEKNKEKIQEYQKEYIEQNKPKLKEYHKEYNSKYYETNKENILKSQKEQYKEIYKNNKNKIAEHNKIQFNCLCGSNCRISDKARHEKTKKIKLYRLLSNSFCFNNICFIYSF
jgi:hypothetical protein